MLLLAEDRKMLIAYNQSCPCSWTYDRSHHQRLGSLRRRTSASPFLFTGHVATTRNLDLDLITTELIRYPFPLLTCSGSPAYLRFHGYPMISPHFSLHSPGRHWKMRLDTYQALHRCDRKIACTISFHRHVSRIDSLVCMLGQY